MLAKHKSALNLILDEHQKITDMVTKLIAFSCKVDFYCSKLWISIRNNGIQSLNIINRNPTDMNNNEKSGCVRYNDIIRNKI